MLLPKLTSILRECVLSSKTGSWNSDGDDGGEGKPELQPQPQQHRSGGGLHARAALSCLRVLCATARRAPWAASKVAHEPGLLDAVREVSGCCVCKRCVIMLRGGIKDKVVCITRICRVLIGGRSLKSLRCGSRGKCFRQSRWRGKRRGRICQISDCGTRK